MQSMNREREEYRNKKTGQKKNIREEIKYKYKNQDNGRKIMDI